MATAGTLGVSLWSMREETALEDAIILKVAAGMENIMLMIVFSSTQANTSETTFETKVTTKKNMP